MVLRQYPKEISILIRLTCCCNDAIDRQVEQSWITKEIVKWIDVEKKCLVKWIHSIGYLQLVNLVKINLLNHLVT